MTVLEAAVVLVGVLCVVDLALTVGVIRRLREYEGLRGAGGRPASVASPGSPVGRFAATTLAGDELTLDSLVEATASGEALVGFFSPHCEPCEKLLPDFVAYASGLAGNGGARVLAVIVGDAGEATGMVQALEPVAHLVVEGHAGGIAGAFQATSFPALFTVDGAGRVTASGHALAAVRRPVPAGRAR